MKCDDEDDLNSNDQSLMELAGNMEEEEHTMMQEKDDTDIDHPEDDDPEEWLDDIDALTAEERNNLAESVF